MSYLWLYMSIHIFNPPPLPEVLPSALVVIACASGIADDLLLLLSLGISIRDTQMVDTSDLSQVTWLMISVIVKRDREKLGLQLPLACLGLSGLWVLPLKVGVAEVIHASTHRPWGSSSCCCYCPVTCGCGHHHGWDAGFMCSVSLLLLGSLGPCAQLL